MTRGRLEVTSVTLRRTGEVTTLSGEAAGTHLFWAMANRESIALRGEPFVTSLLPSAMRTGRDLVLPDNAPVDPHFLDSMAALQVIFARWFKGLQPVSIIAPTVEPRTGAHGRMVGYSGGVDSSYTVMCLGRAVDGTVLFDGIEYNEPNPQLMSTVGAALSRPMAARGTPLTVVQTNVKAAGRATGGYWSEFIGGALASIPHALGLAEYTVAGSNSWENLRPYGTHPVTDPMWGSQSLRIHHHGAESLRIEKLAALASAPDLLDVLRVCFQGADYNCGTCHKCLQTSAALRALQMHSSAMPALEDPRLLRRLIVEHDGDLVDWIEILSPDLEQRDPPLAHELRRMITRYRRRQVAKEADDVFWQGGVRRLLQRLGLIESKPQPAEADDDATGSA